MDAESRYAITQFLFVKHDHEAVDLAFVLGSPTVNSIFPAIALFKAGLTSKILITGAGKGVNGQIEWELYLNEALNAGIPSEAILIEKNAQHTLQNMLFGSQLIEQVLGWENIKSIALCAKPFHMRRVMMTARRFFPKDVRLIACPPEDAMNLNAESWAQSSVGRQRVLEELGKISRYALQGDFDA